MKKAFISLAAILVITFLAGCSEQVESLLEKANQILDQQLEKEEAEDNPATEKELAKEEGSNETSETGTKEKNNKNLNNDQEDNKNQEKNNEAESDVVQDDGQGHGPDDDQITTVEDLINQGEYESIDPPNGYPLPLPAADWHLVQIIKDPEDGHEAWEGAFCFDSEIQSTIMTYEQRLIDEGFNVLSEPIHSEDVADAIHSTKFEYNDLNTTLEGDMNYYLDHYGNGCTKVYLTFN